MIRGTRRRFRRREGVEIQLAPLIDMMFILLIFFLVTTTFVRESGVRVRRPQARSSRSLPKEVIRVGIDAAGRVFMEERRVDLLSLRGHLERRLRGRPEGAVVIVADEGVPTGTLVRVMDECRLAGAGQIAVATRKP